MRRRDPVVSFFMFQDIMMTTMGIVILASLIMALNLQDATPIALPDQDKTVSDLVKQTDELESENTQLRKALNEIRPLIGKDITKEARRLQEQYDLIRLEELKVIGISKELATKPNETDRISVIRKQIDELKMEIQRGRRNPRMTYVVDDDARSKGMKPWLIEVTKDMFRIGRPEPGSAVLKFTDPTQCLDWITTRQNKSEYFVICIKPSGFDRGNALELAMRQRHIKLGIDLIQEQSSILSWSEQ